MSCFWIKVLATQLCSSVEFTEASAEGRRERVRGEVVGAQGEPGEGPGEWERAGVAQVPSRTGAKVGHRLRLFKT